jgi:hypothetical protein
VPSAQYSLIAEISQAMHAGDPSRFRALLGRLHSSVQGCGPDELTGVITGLAPLLGEVAGVYSKLAIMAGAFVEWGGSPLPLAGFLPDRAVAAMQYNGLFPRAWQAASGGRELPEGRTMNEVTGIIVAHAERNGIPADAATFLAMSWFDVEDWIRPMCTCMANRQFRGALTAGQQSRIKETATAIADRVGGARWLQGLAEVLDDEPLIVLHPASGRGFRLTMSGVGDNYQLHTLLADRLSGQAESGIPGLEPPLRAWVEEATSAEPVPHPGTDPIRRRFRLYDGTGAYVYPEGRPADIGLTGGMRVLVVHPPKGNYGWVHARSYPLMTPRLTLDAVLGSAETSTWLGRVTPARETDIMARNHLLRAASRIKCRSSFASAQNAEYSRLTLGLPRHGTCEQMPQFCAAA